jgi:hypothetical protein
MLLLCATPVFSSVTSEVTVISSCRDLQNIADNLSGYYELINDVDCTGVDFMPIGNYDIPFTGQLNGNGHTIMHLSIINNPTPYYNFTGLFGMTSNASIENIIFTDADIADDMGTDVVLSINVGTLAGQVVNTKITNVQTHGKISASALPNDMGFATYGDVGGLVGTAILSVINNSFSTMEVEANGIVNAGGLVGVNESTITHSYATGQVSGDQDKDDGYTGGLVGYNNEGDINYSYSTGRVSGANVGGLVGYNRAGSIANSYASSDVEGTDFAGGLISYSTGDLNLTSSYATGDINSAFLAGGLVAFIYEGYILDTYAKGNVTSTSTAGSVGGLIGYAGPDLSILNSYSIGEVSGIAVTAGGLLGGYSAAIVKSSYWDTQTSGLSVSFGGIPKSTAEMYQQSTYEGWDFTSVWEIQEGANYPGLISEVGRISE